MSYWLLWITTAQPDQQEHHSTINQIRNGKFVITKEYSPPSTEVEQQNVMPWTESHMHMLEISKQADFQEQIIHKTQFQAKQINMCVLRSDREQAITQRMPSLAKGCYILKMKIVAGSLNLMKWNIVVGIEARTSSIRQKKIQFQTDGKEQSSETYMYLPTTQEYGVQIYLDKNQHTQIIVGITQIGLYKCTESQHYDSSPKLPKGGNLVGNPRFSSPKVRGRQGFIKVFANEVPRWIILGMGRIVKCSRFNTQFQCKQAYLFASYPEQVIIQQKVEVEVEGEYDLTLKYTQTTASSQKGQIKVAVNEKLVYRMAVTPGSPQRLTTKYVHEKIQMKKGINILCFDGDGFLGHLAGIMFTDIDIRLNPAAQPEVPADQVGHLSLGQTQDAQGTGGPPADESGLDAATGGRDEGDGRGQGHGHGGGDGRGDDFRGGFKQNLSRRWSKFRRGK